MTYTPAVAIDDVMRAMADRFGSAQLGLAVLFGSRARGEERPGSDVDVGVLAANGKELSFLELGLLKVDLEARAGVPVDVVDLCTPDAVFRFEVVSCGQVLFEDRPGRWAEFVGKTLVDHDDIAWILPQLVRGVMQAAQASAGATPEDERR